MGRVRVLAALLFLVLVLGAAPACDADDDLASHEGILALVPDEPERRDAVWVVDYAALRELPLPGDAPNEDRLAPIEDLTLRAREHTRLQRLSPLASSAAGAFPEIDQNWQTGLGFSIDDIDLDVRAGYAPAFPLGAAIGDLDAAAIDEHLRACDACTQPARLTRAGATYYDWGDGLGAGERLVPPVFDNLGRGGQYLFTDQYLLRADDSSTFLSALDARDTEASLRGNPTFVRLARALDDLEADGSELLASVMSDVHQGPSIYGELVDGDLDDTRQAVVDAAFAVPLLVPYEAYAISAGVRDGQPMAALILIHHSTEAAAENAARLEERLTSTRFWDGQPWSAVFEGWQVERDGSVVVATLEGLPRWEGTTLGDPLLFHE